MCEARDWGVATTDEAMEDATATGVAMENAIATV
jgi:hypothetical protein